MKNLQQVLNTYRTIVIFVTFALILTVVFGAIFGTGQQILRGDANDPQIDVTNQVAEIIEQDVPLDVIVNSEEAIDLHDSESLFVMIFDPEQKLVGSSAQLDGQPPTPSSEALNKAKEMGEYKFTWEPKEGVKVAAVIKAVGDKGYVLAGRSLSEIDKRITTLLICTAIGWAVSIVLALLLTIAIKPRQSLAIIEETNVTVVEESKQ